MYLEDRSVFPMPSFPTIAPMIITGRTLTGLASDYFVSDDVALKAAFEDFKPISLQIQEIEDRVRRQFLDSYHFGPFSVPAREFSIEERLEGIERRKEFAVILRDRAKWNVPADFVWGYDDCETCALAILPGTVIPMEQEEFDKEVNALKRYADGGIRSCRIADYFAMSPTEAETVFFGVADHLKCDFDLVTPMDVANILEAA